MADAVNLTFGPNVSEKNRMKKPKGKRMVLAIIEEVLSPSFQHY